MTIQIPGFQKADDSTPPRLIMSLRGKEKSGKTHFSLTAPGPIAYFAWDVGEEGVMRKFSTDKEVLVSHHRTGKSLVEVGENEAKRLIKEFEANYIRALDHKQVRTLVIDTGTEVWEMYRIAEWGKLSMNAHHYAPVNAKFRALVRRAFDTDKNVIWLHKVKEIFVNEKYTGQFDLSGFKGMPYLTQLNAEAFYDEDGFNVQIHDCRHNSSVWGEVLTGDMCSFPVMASMIFPESDMERWM